MIRLLSLFLLVFALLIGIVPTADAQRDDQCPAIVSFALENIDRACGGLTRNQACYGNVLIDPVLRSPLTFEQVGDRVPLSEIENLALSPMIYEEDAWGLALLSLQANIPNTIPGQNVSVVLMGDTTITNVVGSTALAAATEEEDEEPVALSVTVRGGLSVNVRSGPGTNFRVITQLSGGTALTADGRNEAGDWLRVVLDDGREGWVSAELVNADGDPATLAVSTTGTGGARAQSLTLGEPVTGTISNAVPAINYTFEARAGEFYDLIMQATGNLDTLVIVLGPDGVEIARNDDDPLTMTSDSALRGFSVPADGTYTVVATRFGEAGGRSTGNFTLTLSLNEDLSYVRPMQAFYFTSGIGDALCREMPASGIMIHTPSGAAEIRLLINEVRVNLGSTAYLTADPGGFMEVYVIAGRGRVEAQGLAQIVPEGSFSRIPLSDQGVANGQPEPPQPYDRDLLAALPVQILPEPVAIAEPADPETLLVGAMVITLDWDNDADMDLELIEPNGTRISFRNPSSLSGAQLDVDTNAACARNFGTRETIFWPSGQPLLGQHTVRVNEFTQCNEGPANWTLTVRVGDTILIQESGTGNAEFTFAR